MIFEAFFLVLDCEPHCEQFNSHDPPHLPEQGSLHQDAEVNSIIILFSVTDPDPGSGAFLSLERDPRPGIGFFRILDLESCFPDPKPIFLRA